MADRSLRTGSPAVVPLLITFLVAAVVGGLFAGLFSLVGGDDEEQPEESELSAAAIDCREQWRDLGTEWETKAAGDFRSDLSPRWSALAASADLQSSTADGEGCDTRIATMRGTAADIDALSVRLRPYDLVRAHERVSTSAQAWIAKQTRPKDRKRAREGKAALATLAAQAPKAVADMSAGWQGAIQVDLGDDAAVEQLLSEFAFLAGDSAPYRKADAARKKLNQLIGTPVSRR